MYPSDPGVWDTSPETPSLPLPPTPTGQATELETPTLDLNSGEIFARKSTKMNVVPDPSERWTNVMSIEGRFTPGLSAARAGSFHFVTLPNTMSARTVPLNLSGVVTPGRLYTGTTAPSTVGR